MLIKNPTTLRLRAIAVLQEEGFQKKYILRYNRTWKLLEQYMYTNELDEYSSELGQAFLNDQFCARKYEELNRTEKGMVRHINVLTDIYLHDKLCPARFQKKTFSFDAEGLDVFGDFIQYLNGRRSEATIYAYKNCLDTLYNFLLTKRKKTEDLDVSLMIQFLAEIKKNKTLNACRQTIKSVRAFFRFLCENRLIKDNNLQKWLKLLTQSNIKNVAVPSVYSKDEIERMISTFDRRTPQGKRDYAAFLLAARCALRAQDIVNLRFSHINWVKAHIKMRQSKTKILVDIDLTEEVGQALIDYIKNGRPKITNPFVFLTCRPPYKQINSATLDHIVKTAIQRAGIQTKGRKQGPHALRHSLATNLLKEGTPLPVITGILGHSNSQSTTIYTHVDIANLRKCALEVPLVPLTFYDGLYGK